MARRVASFASLCRCPYYSGTRPPRESEVSCNNAWRTTRSCRCSHAWKPCRKTRRAMRLPRARRSPAARSPRRKAVEAHPLDGSGSARGSVITGEAGPARPALGSERQYRARIGRPQPSCARRDDRVRSPGCTGLRNVRCLCARGHAHDRSPSSTRGDVDGGCAQLRGGIGQGGHRCFFRRRCEQRRQRGDRCTRQRLAARAARRRGPSQPPRFRLLHGS